MDEIQKVLVKVGRKDLAVKYYKKITNKLEKTSGTWSLPDSPSKIKKLKEILLGLKTKKYDLSKIINDLYNIVGDDKLFDLIGKQINKQKSNDIVYANIRNDILNYLSKLIETKNVNLDIKALEKLVGTRNIKEY